MTFVLATTPVAVTVYPHHGWVTRQGQWIATPGEQTLQVLDLPPHLQPQTLQGQIQGQGGSVVGRVEAVTVAPAPEAEGAVAALTQEVQHLEQALRQEKDAIAALMVQREWITTLAQQSAQTCALGFAQGNLSLHHLEDLLAYLGRNHSQLGDGIALREQQKSHLDQTLQTLRQTLKARRSDPPNAYHATLRLRIDQAGPVTLRLSYGVDQAGWVPSHEVDWLGPAQGNKAGDNHRLRWETVAQVRQATGEPWPQVRLRLMTAAPAPPGPPWQVTPAPSRSPGPLPEPYRMMGALPGSELPLGSPKVDLPPPTHPDPLQVPLVLPHPVTLPSQPAPQAISLGHRPLLAQIKALAHPQHWPHPHLQVEGLLPPEGAPLLPGRVRLFRGGEVLGQDDLAYGAPGQRFCLDLGWDDRLQVQRELVQSEEIPGEVTRLTWAYRLRVCNGYGHPVPVTVVEKLPLSGGEGIVITLETAEPAPSHQEAGRCEWTLTLGAKATVTLHYRYSLTYPAGPRPLGLPQIVFGVGG